MVSVKSVKRSKRYEAIAREFLRRGKYPQLSKACLRVNLRNVAARYVRGMISLKQIPSTIASVYQSEKNR